MSASLACTDTDVSVSKATEYTAATLFSTPPPPFSQSLQKSGLAESDGIFQCKTTTQASHLPINPQAYIYFDFTLSAFIAMVCTYSNLPVFLYWSRHIHGCWQTPLLLYNIYFIRVSQSVAAKTTKSTREANRFYWAEAFTDSSSHYQRERTLANKKYSVFHMNLWGGALLYLY